MQESSPRPRRRSRAQDRSRQAAVESLLSGEADSNDTYLEVHSGAGGTESQDWASMLLRMYTRWAERAATRSSWSNIHDGEEAGIKSATLLVKGHNAYGWLKTESGVHRLVRISPYDSQCPPPHLFRLGIWVYPVIDDSIEIEVNESDCRIDTYRASGAGGQHVNTTDSAVRITHNPTGIVVQCQNERSQHKNRATAWDMLRARLYEAELKKREEEANAEAHQDRDRLGPPDPLLRSAALSAGEGPAHRHRKHQSPRDVLDGDLDEFMEAALAQRVYGGEARQCEQTRGDSIDPSSRLLVPGHEAAQRERQGISGVVHEPQHGADHGGDGHRLGIRFLSKSHRQRGHPGNHGFGVRQVEHKAAPEPSALLHADDGVFGSPCRGPTRLDCQPDKICAANELEERQQHGGPLHDDPESGCGHRTPERQPRRQSEAEEQAGCAA
jgi:peptide chain release factor 2